MENVLFKQTPRVCVYGAGAMGTSLGALLTRAGVNCTLVSRNVAHVAALNQRGATLKGNVEGVVPVTACLPEEMGEYDVIFLATKQRDNREIAQFLKGRFAADGVLISVQNGLPEGELAEVLGEERVYGCTLSWGAERTGNGEVNLTSKDGLHMGLGAYENGSRLQEIAQMLGKIGSVTVGSLNELRYAKLSMNAAFSSLSALSGLSFGEISRKYKKYALTLIRETFAVAREAGCEKLPQNGHDLFKVFSGVKARFLLPIAMKKYENARSGMLVALEKGERCEIDFISGAIVREGKRYGVKTPMQEKIVSLIHDVENGFCELSKESIYLLDEI